MTPRKQRRPADAGLGPLAARRWGGRATVRVLSGAVDLRRSSGIGYVAGGTVYRRTHVHAAPAGRVRRAPAYVHDGASARGHAPACPDCPQVGTACVTGAPV